nr:hypothetical protein [Streptomyces sp. MBT65]
MVDPAFDGAGVPACTQALEHGIPVLLQTGGEGMQSGRVLGADGDDPAFEVLTGAGLKDLCEAADVLVEGLQLRAVGRQGDDLLAFSVGQLLGVPHHPAGDPADSWWCGCVGGASVEDSR